MIGILWYIEGYRYICLNRTESLLDLDRQYEYLPRVKSKKRVVVSLTTIPDRIDKLIPTLGSIYTQSVKVDQIILNIPYVSRKGQKYVIPSYFKYIGQQSCLKYLRKADIGQQSCLKYCKHIKINRVIDTGPSTKLLPTLKLFSSDENTRIIVIDDDQIYGSCFIEKLMDIFESKRGKMAVTNYGAEMKTSSWDRVSKYGLGEGYVDILFGCGGYVVTPKMFPPNVFDYSVAPESAIYVDDNWFSGWLRYNNVKIYMMGLKMGTCFFLSSATLGSISLSGGPNKNKKHEKIVNKWFRDFKQ